MLSVEIYLATYALGDFKISYYKMGPTELRILLSIGNLAVLWKSTVHLFGRAHRLFDVAGTLGISGMLLIMVISAVRNTIRLYRKSQFRSASRCQMRQRLVYLFPRLQRVSAVNHVCEGKAADVVLEYAAARLLACLPADKLRSLPCSIKLFIQ